MPADLLCRVVLPTGEPCGYQPEGKDRKEQIANLFRHEHSHLTEIKEAAIEAMRLKAIREAQ